MFPLVLKLPWDGGEIEAIGTPEGNRLVTTKAVAELGPTFETTMDKVKFLLATAGAGVPLIDTATSAAALVVVTIAALLFAGFGSTSSALAVTMFVAVPERVIV